MILYRPGRRFVAQYTEVDTEIVWAIVQNEVPQLLAKAEALSKEEQ